MKQLLSLFLLLLPCLAWAQYPSNGNQKITLGEQTTADGLIYRGIAADTTTTAKSDTAAYFVLDTANINLYTYKASATGRKWRQLGADTASIAYVNTYGDQTVNGAKTFTTAPTFSTALGVASGGTGATSFSPNNYLIRTNSSGIFDTSAVYEAGGNVGIGTASPSQKLSVNGAIMANGDIILNNNNITTYTNSYGNNGLIRMYGTDGLEKYQQGLTTGGDFYQYTFSGLNHIFYTNNAVRMSITSAGDTWLKGRSTTANFQAVLYNDNSQLAINATNTSTGKTINFNPSNTLNALSISSTGTATFSSSVTATTGIFTNYAGGGTTTADLDNTGQIVRTSSIELKNNISNIKYGLNDILKINPISFNWKDENKYGNENENGFVAEDVYTIIPNVVSSDSNGIFMDYKKLIPILTKAIQEQQALIKALEQRIINLENK